jgi:hypothetical protein
MFILLARNITNLSDVSSYDVEARVNHTIIWRGQVHGHTRTDGWEALVKRIAAVAEAMPRSQPQKQNVTR